MHSFCRCVDFFSLCTELSLGVHNVIVVVTSCFSDLRSKTTFDVSQWISLYRMLKTLLAYILCYHDPIYLLAAEEMQVSHSGVL